MRPASDTPESTLIIPFAHASAEACHAALNTLALPHLSQLLGRWHAGPRDTQDDYTLTPPHERALGWALGWTDPGDGRWPWAAWHAARPQVPCAWLTPCHWSVGMEQVTVLPPDGLDLTEAESVALLEALQPWAREDGLTLVLESPTRWRAEGEPLRDLACASLDRVAHRRADAWLPQHQHGPGARLMLRLQNEAQMLFYQHPVHDARQARGVLPINGFWVSASGVWDGQAPRDPATTVRVDTSLRAPALEGDWATWAQAWRTLDETVIGPWLQTVSAPPNQPRQLVLCGEQGWASWQSAAPTGQPRVAPPWWQRWWRPAARQTVTPLSTLSAL